MMKSMVVSCENIHFNYGPIKALRDFNFSVQEGEVSAIIGPNGAGKTTSVRLMNGLLPPGSGRCSILGMDPHLNGPDVRMRTGVLTESPALYERLTPRQNLAFFGGMYGLDDAEVSRRERKTIEALLYTPAEDAELLAGKVAAAAIPAVRITWIGFAVYVVILNTAPYRLFYRVWFPLPIWWPLIFWISPALVFLGIAITVLISAKVPNFLGA